MKEFNRGDLVTSTNKYSEVFKEEVIYLGVTKTSSGTNYHVIGLERKEDVITVFIPDNEIELIAMAKYIPIPKFHKGDIAFFIDNEIVILSERDEELKYLCFNSTKGQVEWHQEILLEKEKPELKLTEGLIIRKMGKLTAHLDLVKEVKEDAIMKEAFEEMEDEENNEDPNEEHNSNYMKDSMPTLEKKDH